MTLLTPTAVLVGPVPLDLANPPQTCPTCALHRHGAQHAHQLHLAAEDREARQRDEIAQLETDLAQARAGGAPAYEPAKSSRTFGGVA